MKRKDDHLDGIERSCFRTRFDVKEAHNHQNDRVWLKGKPPLEERMVTRRQKPKQLMVWAGISYTGKTPLIFMHEGAKAQGPQYCAILENKFLPWSPRYFGEEMWTYQWDGASSYNSEETKEWIARNFLDLIWPLTSEFILLGPLPVLGYMDVTGGGSKLSIQAFIQCGQVSAAKYDTPRCPYH
ncbi:hypothetical protein ANCDUO_11829 [Ancylostoma duodenale]|uniref:Uncharacterized protein n=1 Tax=Ancylostoma duodenale TaxID=51022 RepID=A0A0C2GAF6_9BILA|nr:hypothetical protein ANCDUO_11829 [Ancylostoma duodenale]